MIADAEMFTNDSGTVITMSIKSNGDPVNIINASVKKFYIRKPGGTVITVDPEIDVNGRLAYTITDEIDTGGIWKVQAYLELPNGKWHSKIKTIKVNNSLA
jgi:hypothetical protein